ncbi:MAG: Ig-like domain-containing protein, partial [Bacteroidetes bacterium]|nr:Ig-like domain-containing protein [Bacteroidota bacterium]
MKKTITTAFALLVGAAVSLNAQNRYAAMPLNFTNSSEIAHEFGFSSVEFNGYTILGTEFNDHINVYKDGFFLFQATTPIPHEYPTVGFGHALGMNQNWVAAGTFLENSVYMSKNVNGVPQKDFSTILKPLTSTTSDRYGASLDIYGDWMVVGAPNNPNAAANTRGYVELWKQNASGWTRTQKIQPTNLPVDNLFGCAVAMYGDYLVVGATGAKKILLYKQTNGVWNLIDSYSPDFVSWNGPAAYNASAGINYSKFGWDVEIYKDKVIVGDPGNIQKAAILNIVADKLVFAKTLLPVGYSATTPTYYGDFGHSVAIGYNMAVVGAPYSYGPALTFRQNEGKAFFYGADGNNINYMYAGNVAGTEISGLGYISKVGNTPPNVSVKAVTSSTNFIAPGNIFIRTNTLDVDGSVSKVEYYEGTKLLATSVITPHEFNYTYASAGTHTLTIKAYDNLGAVGTTTTQFVVSPAPLNNVSPTVVLTNPVTTKTYNRDAPITMIAVPSDVDGTISSVHFYDYETEIGVATKAPYTCVWKAVGGTHALKAVAFDNKGAFGLSYVNVTVNSGVMCGVPEWNETTNYKVGDVVSYKNYLVTCIAANTHISPDVAQGVFCWKFGNICPGVNQAPKVSITSPLNNSTVFRTDTAFVTAVASDVDGDVSKVEFFANGNKCGERTSSPYKISFPISSGQFKFTAKVTDNQGATSTSQIVTVDYNTPPTVSIT